MDRFSYNTYGNIVIATLLIMSLLFGLLPYFFVTTYIFIKFREKFDEQLHGEGLNTCYLCTTSFFFLVFTYIKLSNMIINEITTFIIVITIILFSTFATSTAPNKAEKMGKMFWGRKKENGKYADLFRFVKFYPTDKRLCDYEDRLKETNLFEYYIFKYIFRDGLTWDETMDKLDIYERKELDKEIYAIYRTLQYVLDLERL